MSDALNSSIPQIFDTVKDGDTERRVLNTVETEAAKEKLQKIKTAFQKWIWSDPDRTDRLARLYNDTFNNIAPRSFNGDHLQLPGASGAFSLYGHQKRAIWRIISAGSTYVAHAVGAGKTLSIVAAIMEQRRLGLINKAMLVVPGHCLAQAAREFLALYPNARILVADETNFVKEKRHRFLSRAATANWDAIIITHSAFRFISIPSAFESQMIQDELEAYEELLTKVDREDRLSRKRIERMKEGHKERLEALSTRKDDLLTISEIGIDQIIVDEAQEFRKLSFATNMSTLKGVDPNGSQRAWDLYVKSRFVETKNPGRALVLASGTPITNTLGEMFTVQRLMDNAALTERGLHEFDAWASTFGDTSTELELQPSGKYKPVTRFAQFVNVPELIAMFRSFADVVQPADLRTYVKVPGIAGGKRQIITAEPTPAFKAYQRHLDQRIQAIEERDGPAQPGDDILLSVITDGRHAAIDLRLVMPAMDNEDGNKLNALVRNTFRIWQETAENVYVRRDGKPFDKPGAGQLIFSDLGTINVEASRGFSAYRWIRDELVRLPLTNGVAQKDVAAQMNAIPAMAQENAKFWNWLDAKPNGRKKEKQANAFSFDATMDSGLRVLGNVELKGRFLHLSTNSVARAEKGTVLIRKALGDIVGTPLTEIRTVEQMMAERPPRERGEATSEVPPEIAEQVVHQFMDRQYRETLDQPVGMLGNKTPRQAAKSAAGRQKVAEWLKYLENQSAKQAGPTDPMATYSFEWMWKELGVHDLRR